ncbi:MAG: UpxY family transcription antiterminator, partial [Chitinophagaceae bacterium]
MDINKNWYIVYTRSGNEKRVALLLDKKGFETYCPSKKLMRHPMDRRKFVSVSLFSCYVFVRATEADQDVAAIRETDGFQNFVYWRAKPAIVSNDEIDTIKKFLAEYDHVSIEKSEVTQNGKVRVLNGPLVLWEGNVVEVMTDTVKIQLPSLGY